MTEWTTLIKNAIAVMVIIVALGVIIFLVYLGLNAANRGGDQLVGAVHALDRRAFESYDNTVVSGTQVLAAIRTYRDQPIGVVVRVAGEPNTARNYCARINNAVPAVDTNAVATPFAPTAATHIAWSTAEGALVMTANWAVHQDVQYNNTRTATSRSDVQYVNPTGRFRAVLIMGINNQILGIHFHQVANPALPNPWNVPN